MAMANGHGQWPWPMAMANGHGQWPMANGNGKCPWPMAMANVQCPMSNGQCPTCIPPTPSLSGFQDGRGTARHGRHATFRHGTAREYLARHGRHGTARHGKKEKVVKNWVDRFVAARVCQKKALKNQKMARPFRSCEGLPKKGV